MLILQPYGKEKPFMELLQERAAVELVVVVLWWW